MEAGIVGLSYIGKTTLFNALSASGAGPGDAAAAGRPNVGVVNVPDPRLGVINRYVETKKIVYATLQLVDVAGLVAGASKGEGLGNKFLSHLRRVDALLHLVRCFDDPNVPHVDGSVDPVRDIEAVETELMLADLEQIEGMMDKARKQARTGDRDAKLRLEVIETCGEALGEGRAISSLDEGVMATADAEQILRGLALLSAKPVLYVANVSDQDLDGRGEAAEALRRLIQSRQGIIVPLCAKLEEELIELDAPEQAEMLEALGLREPALPVLARAAYDLLGLHSFFTCGPKEIRAWPVPKGSTAPQAAGSIHTDLQRGFIRAEVYGVDDLDQYACEQAIRAAGRLRVEGKNYTIKDGDVCHFLFNV